MTRHLRPSIHILTITFSSSTTHAVNTCIEYGFRWGLLNFLFQSRQPSILKRDLLRNSYDMFHKSQNIVIFHIDSCLLSIIYFILCSRKFNKRSCYSWHYRTTCNFLAICIFSVSIIQFSSSFIIQTKLSCSMSKVNQAINAFYLKDFLFATPSNIFEHSRAAKNFLPSIWQLRDRRETLPAFVLAIQRLTRNDSDNWKTSRSIQM